MTTGAARQQRSQDGVKPLATLIRLPPELVRWYQRWAASHDPPISQALAMRQALEAFKATHE